jgi:GT2 family glycosyltransferase
VTPRRFTPEQVSVIVCTRNRPDLLERCLGRLAELAPAPLEIVVIDQSDGNESGEVMKRFQARLPHLRGVATPTRGLSRARNLAIRESRGEILAFTDDDCLARRDWVGAIVRAFSTAAAPAAVTGPTLPEQDSAVDPRILAAATWCPPEARLYSRPVDPSLVGGGFNFSVRRDIVDRIGDFDPELGAGGRYRSAEDTDYVHRMLAEGASIQYDPSVVVSHLVWRNGDTQSAVEWEYGYGIAVWALKRATRRDFFPLGIASRVLVAQSRTAVSGIIRRDATAWRTGRAYLAGLGRGLASWLLFSGFSRPAENLKHGAKSGA